MILLYTDVPSSSNTTGVVKAIQMRSTEYLALLGKQEIPIQYSKIFQDKKTYNR